MFWHFDGLHFSFGTSTGYILVLAQLGLIHKPAAGQLSKSVHDDNDDVVEIRRPKPTADQKKDQVNGMLV